MISLRFYTIVFKDNIKAIWSELAFICIVNWTVFKRILVKLKLRLQTSLSGRLTVSTSQAVLYIFISFCFENRGFCNLYRGLKNSSKHRVFHSPFDSRNVQDTSHNSIEVFVLIFYSLVSKCNALFIAYVFTVWKAKKRYTFIVYALHTQSISWCAKLNGALQNALLCRLPPDARAAANAPSRWVTRSREIQAEHVKPLTFVQACRLWHHRAFAVWTLYAFLSH